MSKQYWKPGNMLYPVPAVMISCAREGEKPNIITVAWAATVCTNPPMLSVSIRPERHSYEIIKDTKEFVVNLVTKDLVFATDYCGVRSGRDVDKFKEMNLTPFASKNIKAPGIEESPVNIECKLVEIKELGSHHMFLAEVVGVTVDDRYMNEVGKFELNETGLVAYSHGEYFELGEKVGKFGYSVRKEKAKSKDAKQKAVSQKKTNPKEQKERQDSLSQRSVKAQDKSRQKSDKTVGAKSYKKEPAKKNSDSKKFKKRPTR